MEPEPISLTIIYQLLTNNNAEIVTVTVNEWYWLMDIMDIYKYIYIYYILVDEFLTSNNDSFIYQFLTKIMVKSWRNQPGFWTPVPGVPGFPGPRFQSSPCQACDTVSLMSAVFSASWMGSNMLQKNVGFPMEKVSRCRGFPEKDRSFPWKKKGVSSSFLNGWWNGWWFLPPWKVCLSFGIIPFSGMENRKPFKPPASTS